MFLELSFAYLVGSIPFGKLLTKFLTNKDITQTGSGNIGATNVYRSVSKKAGVTVLLLDGIKPIIVLLAILYISPEYFFEYKYLIFLFSIIGHIFPIWLNFKGGKGVACYFGGNLAFEVSWFGQLVVSPCEIWEKIFSKLVLIPNPALPLISLLSVNPCKAILSFKKFLN